MNDYITNQNDIYMYFEIINQLEPSKVLDIGMFLKRIGAVSRQCMNCGIDREIILDGIELMGDISLPIYSTVYDNVTDGNEFIKNIRNQSGNLDIGKKYDLTYNIRTEEFFELSEEQLIWSWLEKHTKYAVVEQTAKDRLDIIKNYKNYKELTVGEDTYLLICFER